MVDVLVACLLVFDESVEALVYCRLQLVLVIDELDDLVACIFEVLNNHIVVTDDVTAHADRVEDLRLAHAQVLHHEAQTRIHLVVLLQPLVHLLRLIA